MSVTSENLTLCTCQTNPRLELAARRDVLDRPWKTSRGLRQVERTRGQNATSSVTAAPHFVPCGISPSHLDSLEILPWPSPQSALRLTSGPLEEPKREKYSGWLEEARGGETCTPPLSGRFGRILVSAASRVKVLNRTLPLLAACGGFRSYPVVRY